VAQQPLNRAGREWRTNRFENRLHLLLKSAIRQESTLWLKRMIVFDLTL
jgi:hypothetical protein